MRTHLGFALSLVAFACFWPANADAASPAEPYLGKVVIDVSNDGEAWYVNPQSHMRVYLGRPEEALERLTDRAVLVSYRNIARLAEMDGLEHDAEYAREVAGQVLAPSDLVGAAWYVDPATGYRRRLATAHDAWEVMRTGAPVAAAALAAIAEEPNGHLEPEPATVADVESADTLVLADGAKVRLPSVETPSNPELQEAAKAKLRELAIGRTVMLERDRKAEAPDGARLRWVHAGAANLSYELVRGGLAFHAIAVPNLKYAEQLIVGGIDAARLKRGFWDNANE